MKSLYLYSNPKLIERELDSFLKRKIVDKDKFIEIAQKLARKHLNNFLNELNKSTDLTKLSKFIDDLFGKNEHSAKIFKKYMDNYGQKDSYIHIDYLTKSFLRKLVDQNSFPESVLKEVDFKITKQKFEKVYLYTLVEKLDSNPDNNLLKWNDEIWKVKDLYRKDKAGTEIRNIANSGRVFDFSSIDTEKIKKALYEDVSNGIIMTLFEVRHRKVNNQFPELNSLISVILYKGCECELDDRANLKYLNSLISTYLKKIYIDMLLKYLIKFNEIPKFDVKVDGYDDLYNLLRDSYPRERRFSYHQRLSDLLITNNPLTSYANYGNSSEQEEDLFKIKYELFIDETFSISISKDIKENFSISNLTKVINILMDEHDSIILFYLYYEKLNFETLSKRSISLNKDIGQILSKFIDNGFVTKDKVSGNLEVSKESLDRYIEEYKIQ